jgi:hypothetical protein
MCGSASAAGRRSCSVAWSELTDLRALNTEGQFICEEGSVVVTSTDCLV